MAVEKEKPSWGISPVVPGWYQKWERSSSLDLPPSEAAAGNVAPPAPYRSATPGVVTARLEDLLALARKNSLWPLTFGLACCAIEMMSTYMANHDLDRMGIVTWPSPRQSDVMIVAGTVVKKMAEPIALLYEQMPEPKWVIAMGSCATNGGPYYRSYSVVMGVDHIVPVDVYIPGVPAAAGGADGRAAAAAGQDPTRCEDLWRKQPPSPPRRARRRRDRRGRRLLSRSGWTHAARR